MDKLFLAAVAQYGAAAGGVILILGFISWKLWKSLNGKEDKIDKIIKRHEDRVDGIIKNFTETLNTIRAEHREDHHKTELFLQKIVDRIS